MVGLAAYDASEGGLLILRRSLALGLAPYAILVTAIAPGDVNTDGVRRMQGVEETAPGAADAPVFPASPASSDMTGSLVVADGAG